MRHKLRHSGCADREAATGLAPPGGARALTGVTSIPDAAPVRCPASASRAVHHPARRPRSGAGCKAALLALTATVAAELDSTPVIVNAVDPGLTATWLGAEAMGARPVAGSVLGIVWAATLPDNVARGGFFRDMQPHPW